MLRNLARRGTSTLVAVALVGGAVALGAGAASAEMVGSLDYSAPTDDTGSVDAAVFGSAGVPDVGLPGTGGSVAVDMFDWLLLLTDPDRLNNSPVG